MSMSGNINETRRRPDLLGTIDFYEFSKIGELSFDSIRQLYWYSADRISHSAEMRAFFLKVTRYYSLMKIQKGGPDLMMRVQTINCFYDEKFAREDAEKEARAASSISVTVPVITVDQASSPHHLSESTHQFSQTSIPSTHCATQATPTAIENSSQTCRASAHCYSQTDRKVVATDSTQTSPVASPVASTAVESKEKSTEPGKVSLWYDQYEEEEDASPSTPTAASPTSPMLYPPTPMERNPASPHAPPTDLPYPPTPMERTRKHGSRIDETRENIPSTAASHEDHASSPAGLDIAAPLPIQDSIPEELFLAATSNADLDRMLKSSRTKFEAASHGNSDTVPSAVAAHDTVPRLNGDAATGAVFALSAAIDDVIVDEAAKLPMEHADAGAVTAAARGDSTTIVNKSDKGTEITTTVVGVPSGATEDQIKNSGATVATITVPSSSDDDDDCVFVKETQSTSRVGHEDEVVCLEDAKKSEAKKSLKRPRTPTPPSRSPVDKREKRSRTDSASGKHHATTDEPRKKTPTSSLPRNERSPSKNSSSSCQLPQPPTPPIIRDGHDEREKERKREEEKERQKDLEDKEKEKERRRVEQNARAIVQYHVDSTTPRYPPPPPALMPLEPQNDRVFFRPNPQNLPPPGFNPNVPFFNRGLPFPPPIYGHGPPPPVYRPPNAGPPQMGNFAPPLNAFMPPPNLFTPFNGPPLMNGMNGPPPLLAIRPNVWCAFCVSTAHRSEHCERYGTKVLREKMVQALGLCPHCLVAHPAPCRDRDVYCPICSKQKHHPALCRKLCH